MNDKPQIIAVHPKTGWDDKKTIGIPLGLLYAGSLIHKEGYKIIIIDQRTESKWKEILKKLLNENSFLLISTMTGTQIKHSLEIIKYAKSINPKIKIVLGGNHPTLFPKQTLEHELVDFVIQGDGEEALLELVKNIQTKKDISKIKGLGYKKCNKIFINKPESFEFRRNIKIPYQLVNMNNYSQTYFQFEKVLPILVGKGCLFNCNFCYNSAFTKEFFRKCSNKQIVLKIKEIIRFKPKNILFIDDLFLYSKKKADELCDLIKEQQIKISFIANSRADIISRFSIETLKKLTSIGLKAVYIGGESGSQKILDSMKKNLKVEDIINCNKKLKQTNIIPIFSFIGGFPEETYRDLIKTIDLMIKLKKDNPNTIIQTIKMFTMFPGTKIYNQSSQVGFKKPTRLEEWADFNYQNTKMPWFSKQYSRKLKKITRLTWFVFNTNQSRSKILNFLCKLYKPIALFRCKHHLYSFMPEITLFQILNNITKKINIKLF